MIQEEFLSFSYIVYTGRWKTIYPILKIYFIKSSGVSGRVEGSDFHDLYTIKPFWVGDFGTKI